MSASYCTVDDVLSVAEVYRRDVESSGSGDTYYQNNTNTISTEYIMILITEASNMTRMTIRPRYSIAVIDAYDVYPPVIVALTKLYAAKLLFERQASINVERNMQLIEGLNPSIDYYEQAVVNGNLIDDDGYDVPTLRNTKLVDQSTSFSTNEELETLIETGRGYFP
jgi:hypothetical protein